MRRLKLYLLAVMAVLFTACSSGNETDPEPIDGNESDNLQQVDQLVRTFMSKNKVPGLSLAITYQGKLVFAKGYGFADNTTGEPVTPSTLFRISSISKSVTSAAIMKLVEEGKLNLDDKIFGPGALLGTSYGTQPYKRYITDLTVRHCLQHHVGGWSNSNSDPTMANPSMSAEQLLSWILDNRLLDVPPGTSYAYSNVGFMILGRVIERTAGMSYEQYVKENILLPAGITKMQIGGTTLQERKPNESKYHGVGSEDPYGGNFSRRDANGGWIATASDLVRLFVHMDGFSTVPDILKPATIQTMTTPAFGYKNYANGLYVNGSTWYHGGSYYGSRSHWMRTGNGLCGVVFANSSVSGLQGLLEEVIKLPVEWPTKDLFVEP